VIIKNLLSFALLLEDEFSGKIIIDQGCGFLVNGRRTVPMLKPDGFYVFTGVDAEEYDVTANCPGYRPAAFPGSEDRNWRRRIGMLPLDCSDARVNITLAANGSPDRGMSPVPICICLAPETLSFSVRSIETEENGVTK
jgi:hypothetical protein